MLFVTSNIQEDPQCILASHGMNNGLARQNQAPRVLISEDGKFSYRRWKVAGRGLRDEDPRPYGLILARFPSDKEIVQQWYATAKPLCFAAEGAKIDTYRLENHGWSTGSTTLETRWEIVEEYLS